jgi:nucleoid DNA-binding protein
VSGSFFKASWQENRLVTRRNIANAIADGVGLTQLQTRQIVQKILDSIVSTLVEGSRVELRNFGVFEVRWWKARKARNPRTGENIMVPKRCAVTFKPGLVMEERVEEEGRRHESPR